MFKRKFDFVVIGGATRDFMFYDNSGKFLATPDNLTQQRSLCFAYGAKINVEKTYLTFGGGGANAAINLARQGYKVSVLAAVGEDENGLAIVKNFLRHRVNVEFIERYPDKLTGFSFILTAGKEKEHVIFLHRGANNNFKIHPKAWYKIKTKWFYLTSLSGSNWSTVLDWVFSHQTQVVWNPGERQLKAGYSKLKNYLAQTKILALNKDEAIELVTSLPKNKKLEPNKFKQIKFLLKELKAMGPEIVLITNSVNGADAYDGQNFYHQPARGNQRQTVDTTGVGDCFTSTLAAVLAKYPGQIKPALFLAAKNAAAVVTKVGAQNGLTKVI